MTTMRTILRGAAVAGALLFAATFASGADTLVRGDEKCMACHANVKTDRIAPIALTRHGVTADARTPSCTNCHGASEKHMAAGDGSVKPDRTFARRGQLGSEEQAGACLACHESGKRTHWAGSRHQSEGVVCSSCHTVHTARDNTLVKAVQSETCFSCHQTQRAETMRISHHPIREGKVGCGDCHNPHGGAGPKNLVMNTTQEVCFQCHAEKRGPFLWEHPPVVDDCMTCHTPHGSTTGPLLRAKQPYICQDCHAESAPHPGNVYSAASLPGGRVATINRTGPTNPITGLPHTANAPPAQLPYRSCVNCHSTIHGSNHPSGKSFLR